ncbi:MAG: RNA polymerase sigma-70 factor [Cytophagales bacterium]|nr:RNA polymerase sigma-70 factor [Cytophagales bacterium]
MNPVLFKKLFTQYFNDLCLYAFHFVKNEDTAKDIVQEAFVTVWENKSRTDISNHKAYLFKIVKSSAFRHLSKMTGKINPACSLSDVLSAEQRLIIQDEFTILEDLLDHVPLKSREIFEMSRTMNMKYAEIAEELNISVKTVEKHISQVLHFLLNELERRDIHLKAYFQTSRKKSRREVSERLLIMLAAFYYAA